jgi:hypothetical protein
MTAAALPARHGHADAVTPRLTVAAHGRVANTGQASADAPTARLVPRSETARQLSPARRALADHQAHFVELQAAADRAAKPADRLREQLTQAMVDLQKAEADLAAIDAQHAEAIAQAARAGTVSVEPPNSAEAEAAVANARRNVNILRQALDEVAQDQIKANAKLEAAKAEFDRLVLAVLVSEHALALDKVFGLRDQYHTAEAILRGLHECIGEHGRALEAEVPGSGIFWLQQLEKLVGPWRIPQGHVEMGPREVNAAASRWAAVLHRLKSDPGATF